mmetsp:Transcript_37682/g.60483  ORF Transcript_37682/g.60483 Transcript_37682/m.60483 type:complete len:96 (+) Transcript_37682:562-849(+)
MHLFHGTADTTVSCEQSVNFANACTRIGLKVDVTMFKGKSHTDPILEDAVSGSDLLTKQMLQIVRGNTQKDVPQKQIWNLQPKFMLRMARWCNPF